MRNNLFITFAIMIIGILGFGSGYSAGDKSTELKLKMSEISNLQANLTDKISLAMDKKKLLEEKTKELRIEVKDQNEQFKIKTYQKAILNPRIEFNLKLIQLLLGYISRLNDKILYFKAGSETLSFFYQQAQDDLLMIKALNDLEIDKLIAQINGALDEYIPETRKPMFDVNDVPLVDTEQIWNDIASN